MNALSLNPVAARLDTLTPAQCRRVWALIVADMGTTSDWLADHVRGGLDANPTPAQWVMGTITYWEPHLRACVPGARSRSTYFVSGWRAGVKLSERDVNTARAILIATLDRFIDNAKKNA
jgi:hypothetical protein